MLEDPDIVEVEAEDFRAETHNSRAGSGSWFWF